MRISDWSSDVCSSDLSDAFGGSPVFRYVDNENLGVVEAAIGAGDVGLPSYSTLGPVVQYNSIAPQDEMGLFVSQSFGDFDMKRSEEHTSELQSLMRNSYAVFCLKKKRNMREL